MTVEEFKETEVYKLLMNDIDIKFGTRVNTLLPPPPLHPSPSMFWPWNLHKMLRCLSSSEWFRIAERERLSWLDLLKGCGVAISGIGSYSFASYIFDEQKQCL